MLRHAHDNFTGAGYARLLTTVRCIVGMLLIAAGLLKTTGGNLAAYQAIPFMSSQAMQQGVIFIEFALGIWLLSNVFPWCCWLITLATFGIFTAVSCYLWVLGESSCNCFGRLSLHPGITFSIDLVVVLALIMLRPMRPELSQLRNQTLKIVGTLGSFLVILTVVYSTLLFITGDPWKAIAKWSGEKLRILPVVTDLGSSTIGDSRTVSITLENLTEKEIRVVGGTKSCSCIASDDLPITIDACSSATIGVRFKFTGSVGRFVHRFDLLLDGDGLLVKTAVITGKVTGEPPKK